MAKKMWGGRFAQGTHPLLERFSESLSFDRELANVDIRGSLAHAGMLAKVGLITRKELAAITKGLKGIEADIKAGKFEYRQSDEDIHMAIEAELTRRVGDPARKLHTARSRNDQVATDLRLWCREAIDLLDGHLHSLQLAFLYKAEQYNGLIIPGYTHLQRAQPVLVSQHLLAYVEMLARDRERLSDCRLRVNRLPLGACAMAGTTLPIDRDHVRQALGFDALCENSMDAVADRDFCVELVGSIAILFSHLSRLSEDVILWSSSEWGLVKLPDAWSTGSSIMPQKRNPDLLELTRGKTGRVYGALMALLTLVKGLPMTYNRDLQEDKPQVFDAVRTALATVETLAAFIPNIDFNAEVAAKLLKGGHPEATALAEYLVDKGVPFRKSHEIVGTLVRMAEERSCLLADIPLAEMKHLSPAFGKDASRCLAPEAVVKAYCSAGSAGVSEVGKALVRWGKRLGKGKRR